MVNRYLAFPLAAAAMVVGTVGHADDRATAQQLFQEGKALLSAGKISEACPKFEAAAQLSQTVGVRLNLAGCWEKLGRTASAWAKYDEALLLAERAGDKDAVEIARRGRTELEPRLCYLIISVPKQTEVAGLELTRDDLRLPEAAWGTPVPVDPGEHKVVAKAPGRKGWSTTKSVTEPGSKVTVEVPVLAQEEKAPVAPSATPSAIATAGVDHPRDANESSGSGQRTIGLVAGGLGLVGLGIGSYFGLRAMSKKSGYEDHVGGDGACLDRECQTLSQDAYSAGNAATIGFVAGGVLVATGAVLWLTAPTDKRGVGSARVIPVAGTRSAGLHLLGSW